MQIGRMRRRTSVRVYVFVCDSIIMLYRGHGPLSPTATGDDDDDD